MLFMFEILRCNIFKSSFRNWLYLSLYHICVFVSVLTFALHFSVNSHISNVQRFHSWAAFQAVPGSAEDTLSEDTDSCAGKFGDVWDVIPLCSNNPNLGLGWGLGGLNNNIQDQTQEVSQGHQVGNPGHALRPQSRGRDWIPTFASVLFQSGVCSSRK